MRNIFSSALVLGALLLTPPPTVNGQQASCDSPIYCPGPLLDRIQRAKLFNDSKTFVDKPTKKPVSAVLAAFAALPPTATRDDLLRFVDDNFGQEGTDLEAITPQDWKADPKFLTGISAQPLREWAGVIHGYWKDLSRRVGNATSACEGCANSLLPPKKPFVVPGGRFREIYYWDTYFVFLGLALSEMNQTMSDMIDNFLDYVDKYGFMPNGARIYYLNRSQPPVLTQMVSLYLQSTNNTSSLSRWLPLLDKEYDFWHRNRTVTVTRNNFSAQLNRYDVTNSQPRPESYAEDAATVEGGNFTAAQAAELYADIATGAESGWDFSSRWVDNPVNGSTQDQNLRRLVTTEIIPVDLNAILYANEVTLRDLHAKYGDAAQSLKYKRAAEDRQLAMWNILWNDDLGQFRDWDRHDSSVVEWTSASFWPHWAGVADTDPRGKNATSKGDTCQRVAGAFKILEQVELPGGIPTTQVTTGLQWDYPNSWPPQTYIALNALQRTQKMCPNTTVPLGIYIDTLSTNFIRQSFCSWRETGGALPSLPAIQSGGASTSGGKDDGHMFEKYNVTQVGASGGGGEYTVQTGFGWTNGVVLSILHSQGAQLGVPGCEVAATTGGGNGTSGGGGGNSTAGNSANSAGHGMKAAAPVWAAAVVSVVMWMAL
ncbi:Six-hairpin glycosidase-like protein [Fimicolochytrium jonesii]|uniref:Six-hairpin glycosidase-like protein n=1 Tax=Fimicolochytrium jonesii TaxID=1396493 RepID=UPI0022FE2000|nr:Six-hairpin glycosidase-like protein [Fimicolochytrium jonesii]KAI8816751.1 Six-hairpin glycosidase-like protein [Fimicolochytrium jonesii]